MPDRILESLLGPYNPWWEDSHGAWRQDLPDFHRLVVEEIIGDLEAISQIISVTGPRRVGKTTALRQVICHLLDLWTIPKEQILYFSFDDPAVFGSVEFQQEVFDRLVARYGLKPGGKTVHYFFLDEIQRLPRWELYLKKYYDMHYPIRFVVSGSASSPIFRKSQESLLGRVKDRHLLPFRFLEYCLYQMRTQPEFAACVSDHGNLRGLMLEAKGQEAVEILQNLNKALTPFQADIDRTVRDYCRQGGFPEVWAIGDPLRKMEYLFENQVRKVLYEDLMTTVRYRKPENILRFFVYLLANPGMEVNATKVAKEAGVERRVVEENMPLLELTDLVIRLRKFSHKPLRVYSGNFKCYPVDLALRNAVLKQWEDFTLDSALMGLFAENLVAHELKQWREMLELSFYREKDQEVDFVVTHGGNQYLPIEVKHRKSSDRAKGLVHFMKKFKVDFGVVVTRDREIRFEHGILYVPLRYFLLAN
jgi:uncharacterized protein